MRLLEPLNGLKFAQGHLIMHLAFFISMLQLSMEEEFLKAPVEKKEEGKKSEKKEDLLRFLEGKEKKPVEKKTWKEIKEGEITIF